MKQILLITLIFILQSIPSFGSPLDGTNLICKDSTVRKNDVDIQYLYVPIYFEEGQIHRGEYYTVKDKVYLLRNLDTIFS